MTSEHKRKAQNDASERPTKRTRQEEEAQGGGADAHAARLDRMMAAIEGGWKLGGIVTFADGTPMNVAQLGDTAGLNTLGNQPDATGISPIPSDRSQYRFWNIAAINVTSPDFSWRPGNMGRNTLLRPGTRSADLSLARNIRLAEGHTLNFRFETFNTANHPNWNAPNADARNASTFGVITSAKTMRQLQFALKYLF